MKRSGKRILGAVLLTLGILCLLWFLAPGLSYGIWNIGNLTGIAVSLLLAAAGLTPPMPVQMYYDLKQAGIVLARCPLTLEELAEELCRSQ